jgi:hypothetical protein
MAQGSSFSSSLKEIFIIVVSVIDFKSIGASSHVASSIIDRVISEVTLR